MTKDKDLEDGVWRKTFLLDLVRAIPLGVVETVSSTFAVLIAIRYLGLDTIFKSSIMAAPAVGLLLSLFSVAMVRRKGWSVNLAASVLWLIAGMGFALSALGSHNAAWYLTGLVLALVAHGVSSPLMAQIYRKHYPNEIRGKLFSAVGMVRAGTAAAFAFYAGVLLTNETIGYQGLLWVFAICSVFKGVFTMLMNPVHLRKSNKLHVLEAYGHLKTDKVFRKLIGTWMLLGLGNLMCMVLFVEYAANPEYGFHFTDAEVSIVTTTVPMLAFIGSVFLWGMIYDKMEFYRLRVTVNLFFCAGILVFFLAPNYLLLCVGMALHGMGKAGGNVLWSLWVTKFAPADKVSEYMSVHTSLTGARGIFSAFIAFPLLLWAGPAVVGITGASLILLSSLWLMPEVKENWGKRG